jgi:DNA-binding NtrC family response regulator
MNFIAKSESSKKLLNIAQMSSTLPVNILIIGEKGVGKTVLAQNILPDAIVFDAKVLEEAIINKSADLDQYNELIITNIDNVLNKIEFLDHLANVKIVATTTFIPYEIETNFAIKVDIPPLAQRVEDLEELTKHYVKEANNIYETNMDSKKLDIDLSNNGISLKRSIFKNTFLKSMNEKDMMNAIEEFMLKRMKNGDGYKELLGYFEKPLLRAAKKEYRSQLQMANKLQINRITLRKKLDTYDINEDN